MWNPYTRRAQDFFDPRPTEPPDGESVPGWVEDDWRRLKSATLADFQASGIEADGLDAAYWICDYLKIDTSIMDEYCQEETERIAQERWQEVREEA